MKKTKKLLASLLTAVITLSGMGVGVSAEETGTAVSFDVGGKSVKVGDYFQIGTYYNKPILRRCINADENKCIIKSLFTTTKQPPLCLFLIAKIRIQCYF